MKNQQTISSSLSSTNRPRVRHELAHWACEGHKIRNVRQTNHRVRMLHVWSMLRWYSGGTGLIRDRASKLQEMSALCGMSVNSFKRWAKELHRQGWLHMDEDCIKMTSERLVYQICKLNYFKRVDRIFYLPEKIENEKQTYYWIYLADIEDNKQRQAYKLFQKIKQNPEVQLWLTGFLSQKGYDIQEILRDPIRLASVLSAEYRQNFHSSSKETEMFDWLVENRPDVNRSVAGMAKSWLTNEMNVVYVKKKLVEQKVAFIQKIGTITSEGFRHNKHCWVKYNFRKKRTFQAFCDDIMARKQFASSMQFKMAEPA